MNGSVFLERCAESWLKTMLCSFASDDIRKILIVSC